MQCNRLFQVQLLQCFPVIQEVDRNENKNEKRFKSNSKLLLIQKLFFLMHDEIVLHINCFAEENILVVFIIVKH